MRPGTPVRVFSREVWEGQCACVRACVCACTLIYEAHIYRACAFLVSRCVCVTACVCVCVCFDLEVEAMDLLDHNMKGW